ncbi:DUF4190 domain-containing protein [Agrococcus sp. SL85]|uniref:DUF4190 domain-containing protein n=1 Tax=Agrococcus sp. SL85 TaxID=2995141 RepID=UPI00226C8AFF|nr:DUF4190 domain-containing protein [Agrococcus sp. SL85]WAC67289.1 DUF4190 domain-containing protein [Agrococcus sp. SL85]
MQSDDRYRQQGSTPQGDGARPSYAPPPGWQSPWSGAPASDAPLIHPAAAQQSSATSYGVPVYRAPTVVLAPPPSRSLSITALVLGLCSVTFAWMIVVVPLIGLVFGFLAVRREPAGRGLAIAGLVTSAIGVLLVLLVYVLPLVGFLAALTFSMGS